jgi:hypothetical protein
VVESVADPRVASADVVVAPLVSTGRRPRLDLHRLRANEFTQVFSSRAIQLACALGVLDALLFFLLRPNVNDLWAARARASAVKSGVGLTYWFSWFGGGSTPGNYSVVTPWIAAVIGTETLCALSAAAIPFLVAMLVRGTYHPRAATAVAVVAVGANLWSGRVPFLFASALAVASLIFFREGKLVPTIVLIALSLVATPTPAAFVALGMTGVFISWPARRKQAAILIGVIGAGMFAITLAFGSPGPEPFPPALRVQMICALLLLQLARPERWMRTTLWVSMLAVIAISSFDNALGSNLARWVWFCLPVAVMALSRFKAVFVALIVTPLLIGGWNATVNDLQNAVKPVSTTQYYAPLAEELDNLPDLVNYRVEVVDHGAHAAYAALLDHANLARGWETQEDVALNSKLYARHLNPTVYKIWLQTNAVGYVALPATTVSTFGEYALVHNLDAATAAYLKPVWQNENWRLYKVLDATPIVTAPAQVVRASQASMVVDVPCSCSINVRVHFSKFLYATGPAGNAAIVKDDGNGWTVLTSTSPGTYRLQGKITG